jgi:acylphosphatase
MGQFKAIVHGRVQGVCFRGETVAAARRLGLRGYARNRPDGTVEVVASGEDGPLAQLMEFLHRGPDIARVDRVTAVWDDATPVGSGFEIRH